MIKETVTVPIVGKSSTNMMMFLRIGKHISFTQDILGKKVMSIEDGIADMIYYPDENKEELHQKVKRNYISVVLEDETRFEISENIVDNSITFDFVANDKDMPALRETVLNFIEYDF